MKEINDFLRDKSSKAYEKVVDRLLVSPHFGEKWEFGRIYGRFSGFFVGQMVTCEL